MKLITGVFFTENDKRFPVFTKVGETLVLNEERQPRNMFSGIILPKEKNETPGELDNFVSDYNPDEICGYIFDLYGFAYIFEYVETEKRVIFIKRYTGRPDEIYFSFDAKKGNEWLGTWTMRQDGNSIDSGYASCVIVPVSDQMFDVSRFMDKSLRNLLFF